jgi:hypothetical protein
VADEAAVARIVGEHLGHGAPGGTNVEGGWLIDLGLKVWDAARLATQSDYETSDLTIAIQERAEFKDQRDALAKKGEWLALRVRELEALLAGDVVEAARLKAEREKS